MFWDDWYQQLEQLPGDAPEWDSADAFIERVRQLAQRKQLTLASALDDALQELRNACAAEIEFFALADAHTWSATDCDRGRQVAADQLVRQLSRLFHQDREIRAAEACTAAADREKRAKLESLDHAIAELLQQIRALFTGAEMSPGSEPCDQIPAPTEVSAQPVDVLPDTPDSSTAAPPSVSESAPRERAPSLLIPENDVLAAETDLSRMCIAPPAPVDSPPPPADEPAPAASSTESIDRGNEEDRTQSLEPSEVLKPADLSDTTVELPLQNPETVGDIHDEAGSPEQELAVEHEPCDPLPPDGTAQETAPAVPSTDEAAAWHSLLAQLIGGDDLAGAYWLTRSLEARALSPPFPSWLIAAAQGAMWEPADDPAVAADLLEVTREHEVPQDLHCRLLGLAAALYPAITEPMCNMGIWLELNLPYPELIALVKGARDFARHGWRLRPTDVGGRQSRDQTYSNLRSVVQEADSWLNTAITRHTKLGRANHIWQHMARPRGPMHSMLQPVAQDLRTRLDEVRGRIAEWSSREEVLRQLRSFDLQLHGKHVKAIQASPRDQLTAWIEEACRIAREWCELVDRVERLKGGANWMDQQVDTLAHCVRDHLTAAIEETNELAAGTSAEQVAAARCVRRALSRIGGLFQHGDASHVEDARPEQGPVACLNEPVPHGLWAGLRRRLWWLPEIPVDDGGEPADDQVAAIGTAMERAHRDKRPLREAIEQWMNAQDFRFTPVMIELLQEESELEYIQERHRVLLEGSRHALQSLIDRAEIAIEKAVFDGVLLEVDRSGPQGLLASLRVCDTVYFPPAFDKLNEIEDYIARKRRDRLEYQRSQWEDERATLLAMATDVDGPRVLEFVKRAFQRGDTRVLDECLCRLQEAAAQGIPPSIDWFQSPVSPRDVLADFLEKSSSLEQAHSDRRMFRAEGIQRALRVAGVASGDLPRPRLEEAERAFTAWRNLKKASPRSMASAGLSLLRVLQFLGLDPTDPASAIELVTSRNGWAHFRASVSAGGLSPVPQFGSQRTGDYDVVCLWERPGALTLSARLNEARLGRQPTIVLYLGRLKSNQRLHLARQVPQRDRLQVMVIDEVLLTYLAGERDARLPVCFKIALPFAMINPYAPNSAGNVPREIFVGRNDMICALLDFDGNGSCLVYGGRQLGKSALLRRVQREFHNPTQCRYAVYEDVKLVGDPLAGRPAECVWHHLRDRLKDLGILPRNISTERPDEVARRIGEALSRDGRMRLLVLLDEADCFLDEDSSHQFKNVVELKRLMEESGRRFKVVFAGLHNVQRFQGIPNQPFAHLGTPLLVGPLDPPAARELVERPLEVVGYRFADDGLVLRILSYTNYHPGLIQLFCSKLLDNLYNQSPAGMPRYEITADMVHSVYADEGVQREIRDRFNWTVQLDPRYQAIAWTIIADQYDDRDSFSRLYFSQSLYTQVRRNWPAGFDKLSSDQFRGLLDEMCGLGVLVRSGDGYRLRSPNLVHLMGSEEELILRLMELGERPAPNRVFSADSYREPLDIKASLYSPFTFSQARALARPAFGVGLVFASEALGLATVIDAVKQFIPSDFAEGSRGICTLVERDCRDGVEFGQWLRSFSNEHSKHERLILVQHALADATLLEALVESALTFCERRQRSRRQWMRVLFVLDPVSTWAWLRLERSKREKLEEACDAVVPLKRWDSEGIRLRLSMEDKMESTQVSGRIEDVTHGWPILIDEVFRRTVGVDPRSAADSVAEELRQPSGLSDRFLGSLGLDTTPVAKHVLSFFRGWGSVEEELLPEAIREFDLRQHGTTEEDFHRAAQLLIRLGVLELSKDGIALQPLVDELASHE